MENRKKKILEQYFAYFYTKLLIQRYFDVSNITHCWCYCVLSILHEHTHIPFPKFYFLCEEATMIIIQNKFSSIGDLRSGKAEVYIIHFMREIILKCYLKLNATVILNTLNHLLLTGMQQVSPAFFSHLNSHHITDFTLDINKEPWFHLSQFFPCLCFVILLSVKSLYYSDYQRVNSLTIHELLLE